MKKEKIILFGTGSGAEGFYFEYKDKVEIEFCLDNNISKQEKKETFHNLPIYIPDNPNIDLKCYKIVIASVWYADIQKQLCKKGLVEGQDFISAKIFGINIMNKKMAIMHGNCHIPIMKQYLESSDKFNQEYMIYKIPSIQHFDGNVIGDEILARCDLFIHQDIQKNNIYGYELSDEYTLSKLKSDCIKICIPNLFGLADGFFPQTIKGANIFNKSVGEDKNGMFPHGDENINRLIKTEKIEQIVEILNGDVYDKELILDNFYSSIKKIKQREENWDVKILDFIMDNYKKEKLFYDVGHPCNNILKEISARILDTLGIEREMEEIESCLDAHENPIYPCVRKALDLQFEDAVIRKQSYKKLRNVDMDFSEYIREYIEWCFEQERDE